jgi:Raf kinase inhibitor-like YbhB/YbcL family protein
MLEKLPAAVGRTLDDIRAGMKNIVFFDERFDHVPDGITVNSSAFPKAGSVPIRYTEDGARLSPPINWADQPSNTAAMVLIIEDADSPTPRPLVHAIAWNLSPRDRSISEGALKSTGSKGQEIALGKNSFLCSEYLPPDPPPGHGEHRYVFQLFALDRVLETDGIPGRTALLKAMEDHVISKGLLIGTYERA